jgi:hypothetical protein
LLCCRPEFDPSDRFIMRRFLMSDPVFFAAPRDPAGIATFWPPATPATPRSCQPCSHSLSLLTAGPSESARMSARQRLRRSASEGQETAYNASKGLPSTSAAGEGDCGARTARGVRVSRVVTRRRRHTVRPLGAALCHVEWTALNGQPL